MAVDILFNSLNIGLFDNRTWVFAFFGWAYSGVDFDVPGTGGVDCLHFITACQRITESVPTSLLCILVMLLCYRHLSYPILHIGASRNTDTSFKRMLLVVMCLTWGCEIGFKLATHQMIWIFNPCHVITAVQVNIYLDSCGFGFVLHLPMNCFDIFSDLPDLCLICMCYGYFLLLRC